MLTAKQIQKYSKYSIPKLRKKASVKFNRFIRERDKDKQCCSCNSYNITQASHFYSAGHYPCLEFTEDNVWGSCMKCNTYLSGNLNEYRKKLIKLIGIERVESLDAKADYHRKHGYKHDRFFLIEILEKY